MEPIELWLMQLKFWMERGDPSYLIMVYLVNVVEVNTVEDDNLRAYLRERMTFYTTEFYTTELN